MAASPVASTLMWCLPIQMESPSCKVARSTRRSLTKVPLRLPRSSTTRRPDSKKTRAWSFETARLSTTRSLSGERPMRTGREPTGTSLTVFSSNISDSLAISVTSGGTISACRFLRPRAQPGEPALRFGLERDNDDGNIVDSAAFVGVFDELFGGALWIRLRLESSGNFRFSDHAREAVRTEEQDVALEKRDLFDVHFNFGLRAKSAKQNALQIALFGFAGGQDSAADLFGNQRMIAGELLKLSRAKQIDAAVANVADAELHVFNTCGGLWCAPTFFLVVGIRGREYFFFGG